MRKAYELIDHHHDTILEFVACFGKAVEGRADHNTVQALIGRTREFAQFHFAIEESLMQIVKYPRFAAHRAEHQHVLEQMTSLESRVIQRETGNDWLALLRQCLFEHFDESDKHFVQYAVDRYRDAISSEGAERSTQAGEGITMNAFPWNEVLATGHAEIDIDHRKLVDLFNLLADSVGNRMGSDFCGNILDDIVRTAQKHFELEQRLMADRHYPMAGEHAAEHAMLIGQLQDYRAAFDADSSAANATLLHFTEVWLDFHILFSDKKFSAFLASAE